MKTKSMYRVFDWDNDGEELYFNDLRNAKREYKKLLKDEPQGNWRLYKDTESPYMSGNFNEDCLMSNDRGNL